MKKLLLVLVLLLPYKVFGSELDVSNYTIEKKDDEVIIEITIPKDYEENDIAVTPPLMKAFAKVKFMPGDAAYISLKIINNSKYNYKYVSKSVVVSPINYQNDSGIKGFDNNNIVSVPKRTTNKALIALLNKKNLTKLDISDENIVEFLKNFKNDEGTTPYSSIEDLDDYYLYYYNKLYNTAYTDLNEFNNQIKSNVIFGGNNIGVIETNTSMIKLAYDYFYNDLMAFYFNNEQSTNENFKSHSIGSYINKDNVINEINKYYEEKIGLLKSQNQADVDIAFALSGPYITNNFMDYDFSLYHNFRLQKVIEIKSPIKEVSSENIPAFKEDEIKENINEDIPYTNSSINYKIFYIILSLFITALLIKIRFKYEKNK